MVRLLNFAKVASGKLKGVFSKKQPSNPYGLDDLTPKVDIDENARYLTSLEWAFSNNAIKNIALTGVYGSGKSSIIKTFKSTHKKKRFQIRHKYRFLDISLANFQDDCPLTPGNDKYEQHLERSVLQQIFYKEKNRTLPYSRMKKIVHSKLWWPYLLASAIMLTILLGVFIFMPSAIDAVANNLSNWNDTIPWAVINLTVIVFFILVFTGILYILKASIRSLKLNKIEIEKAGISLTSDEIPGSIFNRNLDEILYFFEATKYNVVIIEDLDRFGSVSIFSKLRELNTLINDYKGVKQKVVFLYAIKDDLFESNERTKFFDFIIPVIATMNSTNSEGMLWKKIESYQSCFPKEYSQFDTEQSEPLFNDNLDQLYVNEIASFIDDRRTLTNVWNEYVQYRTDLAHLKLEGKKLFAIITYKNLYPDDFAKLQKNQGIIAHILQMKGELIEKKEQVIEKDIEALKESIRMAKAECIRSEHELKLLFLALIRENTSDIYDTKFSHMLLENKEIPLSQFMSDDFDIRSLKTIATDDFIYTWNGRKRMPVARLNEIFNAGYPFYERFERVKDGLDSYVEKLQSHVWGKRDEIRKIETYCLSDCIDMLKKYCEEKKDDNSYSQLKNMPALDYMLRAGYIDETCSSYLTYFYDGLLTSADSDYINSVKIHSPLPTNHKLTMLENIIAKLPIQSFASPAILNFYMVNFLTTNSSRYKKQFTLMIQQITQGSKNSIEFVLSCATSTEIKAKRTFFTNLFHDWLDIWNHVILNEIETPQKEELIGLLCRYAQDYIISMDVRADHKLQSFIANCQNISNIARNGVTVDELKKLYHDLDITMLRPDGVYFKADPEFLDFIIAENRYNLTSTWLDCIMRQKTSDEAVNMLKLKHYTAIQRYAPKAVRTYVEQNLAEYVKTILLGRIVIDEDTEWFLQLISGLEDSLCLELLSRQTTRTFKMMDLPKSIQVTVLDKQLLSICWENVLYTIQTTDDTNETERIKSMLPNYLSNDTVLKKLSREKMQKKYNDIPETRVNKFCQWFWSFEGIDIETFAALIPAIAHDCKSVTKGQNAERHKLIVESNRLVFSWDNLLALDSHAIQLKFVVQNQETYITTLKKKSLSYTELDYEFLGLIISSKSSFKTGTKNTMVQLIFSSLDTAQKRKEILQNGFLDYFVQYLVNTAKPVQVTTDWLQYILSSDIDVRMKLRLLKSQVKPLEDYEVESVLSCLPTPYNEIRKFEVVRLPRTMELVGLLKVLESKGFLEWHEVTDKDLQIQRKAA